MTDKQLEYLDDIAREAWEGNYERIGGLSHGERRYVALASGRMRELVPDDSIAHCVDCLDAGWLEHMIRVWRSSAQPKN